jgi:prepilin-type N-terminal cleavage/methylation domain-containing protein
MSDLALVADDRDAGFTLIEVLIALLLSAVIAGVTVSAMLTSMNVIDVTTQQISGSTDTTLVAGWFSRDAQAADQVSIANTSQGWQRCIQPGALVVRFSWTDHVSADRDRDVVVTYALAGAQLTRRACVEASGVDLVLARHLASAVATCGPARDCSGAADTVSLRVTGSSQRIGNDQTFTASLRDGTPAPIDSVTNVAAPLVVLPGDKSTPCPPLQVDARGTVQVLGDVVVDTGCGSGPVGGDASRLRASGALSTVAQVADPLASLVQPQVSCDGRSNPSPVGAGAKPTQTIVHPRRVTVSGTVEFAPGRYVFCDGLEFAADAIVHGADVVFVVLNGGLTAQPGARLDLSAPRTGEYASLLFWMVASQQVRMDFGTEASTLRGQMYAPTTSVSIDSQAAVALGGIVTRSARFGGDGVVRLGQPIATITIDPGSLPPAEQNIAYPGFTLTATGGEAPYHFAATGLPAGITIDADGTLSGSTSAAGSYRPVITAIDATGVGVTVDMPLEITVQPTISSPATLPEGRVGQAYADYSMTVSGGTAPFTWKSGGLPDGITMSGDGILTGAPTTEGAYTFKVAVIDANGSSETRVFDMTVGPAMAIVASGTLPSGQVGLSYLGATLTASGGQPPYTWSAVELPPGLKLTSEGQLLGTPEKPGEYVVQVLTTDQKGMVAAQSFTIRIADMAVVPANCPAVGAWRGEYYDNMDVQGDPVWCQDDATIDFSWQGQQPAKNVPADKFSVRWTRVDKFAGDTYQFTMTADDGARLYVDGALLIDRWIGIGDPKVPTTAVNQYLAAGEHTIVMEYVQESGDAIARLTSAPAVAALCPGKVEGWMGEYFPNRSLDGPPTLCRDDANVKFDWGKGSPGDPIPADEFSARWTRRVEFTSGTYLFELGADDGARLFIDGRLAGDWWDESTFSVHQVKRRLRGGMHTVTVEYFDATDQAAVVLGWSMIDALSPAPTRAVAADDAAALELVR